MQAWIGNPQRPQTAQLNCNLEYTVNLQCGNRGEALESPTKTVWRRTLAVDRCTPCGESLLIGDFIVVLGGMPWGCGMLIKWDLAVGRRIVQVSQRSPPVPVDGLTRSTVRFRRRAGFSTMIDLPS